MNRFKSQTWIYLPELQRETPAAFLSTAAGDSGEVGLFFQDGDFVPGNSRLHYEHMTW